MADDSQHLKQNGKSRTSNAVNVISKSIELQIFEQACLELVKSGFIVKVGGANHDHGLIVHVEGADWCRECQHLKAFEEMSRPGACLRCAPQEAGDEKA